MVATPNMYSYTSITSEIPQSMYYFIKWDKLLWNM